MKVQDLLLPSNVLIDMPAADKRRLLQEMATKAATSLGLDVNRIAPHLLKREELRSTGIGGGVAVPHARLPDVKTPFGLMARTEGTNRVRCDRWARSGYRIRAFASGRCRK